MTRTTLDLSQIEAPSLSSMGFSRRGPLESWNIARSTSQVTMSCSATEARPLAWAISFWASVCAVIGLVSSNKQGRRNSGQRRVYCKDVLITIQVDDGESIIHLDTTSAYAYTMIYTKIRSNRHEPCSQVIYQWPQPSCAFAGRLPIRL